MEVVSTMRVAPTGPDLFAFLDHRAFLAAWVAAQKAADARFSFRLFARRAGVRSPSLLPEIIAGKRNLTATTTEGFVRALRLDHDEAAFFTALVALGQAETEDEKNAAWERASATRGFRRARAIEGGFFEYLSTWYLPAIRELALCADFQPDPAWIAARLRPRITLAQARDALDRLLALGLLTERDGRVQPAEVSVATAHEVAGLALHNYHRQMLDRARDSITGALAAERHLCGVTVAIPASLVPRLKRELDAFQERVLALCDERASEAERVYQVELALFPLSAKKGDE
jgi:uncharacterized protein (TIGR02147 family)